MINDNVSYYPQKGAAFTTMWLVITKQYAINIVGFGKTNATECSSGTDYWIIRNSWGTTWGLLDYGMIQRWCQQMQH
jgi:C1A family cysteine protease